ncbi:MAG TPA: hypothetical protein VM389_12555, partial [Phycisphaerae bacterium]|nr:hypothetical protein [Phycisphaerae bacterium]
MIASIRSCRGRLAMPGLLLVSLGLCTVGAAKAGEVNFHFRTLAPPKVLYLADSAARQQTADMLACKMPADVTFAPLNYGDMEQHHLCDKPLEEPKQDVATMRREGAKYVDGLLA